MDDKSELAEKQNPTAMDGDFAPDDVSVKLRTLVWLRWMALFGQVMTVLVVDYLLKFSINPEPVLTVIGVAAALNLFLHTRPANLRIGEREAVLYMIFDTIQLTALLFLTGGLQNPFAAMILISVTLASALLSARGISWVIGVTFLCLTLLAFIHRPLPWRDGGLLLDRLYSCGVWTALMLGTAFISIYVSRLMRDARQMSAALVATKWALARQQRLAALGGLAAASAHQLGTPLNTITLIAHDLVNELPKDSALYKDALLLKSQSDRCREILAHLSQNPDQQEAGLAAQPLPLSSVLALAADGVKDERAAISVRIEKGAGEDPVLLPQPELLHALSNLIQNAKQHALTSINLSYKMDGKNLVVAVADDGNGFAPEILARLGEPYIRLSDVRKNKTGLGLGIFISKTLLEQLGAKLRFGNGEIGAYAEITWPAEKWREEMGRAA